MVDQVSAFASEVTRIALEVGTQGILGGQAKVEGVQGTLANLTRNVNKMTSSLTDQVPSIPEVTKALALGDLGKLVNADVQGEMLELKMAVDSMVAQLSTLANEVPRVSLEVCTEYLAWTGMFRECGRSLPITSTRWP